MATSAARRQRGVVLIMALKQSNQWESMAIVKQMHKETNIN